MCCVPAVLYDVCTLTDTMHYFLQLLVRYVGQHNHPPSLVHEPELWQAQIAAMTGETSTGDYAQKRIDCNLHDVSNRLPGHMRACGMAVALCCCTIATHNGWALSAL